METKSHLPHTSNYVEEALLTAVLNGTYPPGSTLPNERELAARLHVTRPTLREVLRRLERDGWFFVQHGKSTIVNNYWKDGGLNVLSVLVRYNAQFSSELVVHLLEIRQALSPVYTANAIQHDPAQVIACLQKYLQLENTPEAFAAFDWQLHRTLTQASANPIYPLLLNSFAGFYTQMAYLYFSSEVARQISQAFYEALLTAAKQKDIEEATRLTQAVMRESIVLWKQASRQNPDVSG